MKKIFSIFILYTLYLILNTHSAFAANLSFSPATQIATVSAKPTVSINVSNITNLGSYEFTLKFDPKVLKVLSGSDGGFLGSTGQSVTPLSQINNSSGSATFAAFSFGQNPSPSGSGTLANIVLESLSTGTSPLTLQNIILTDNQANDISFATSSGQIIVTGQTQTPSASESAVLALTKISNSILTGSNFDIGIDFDTKTASISGVDAIISYDPSKFVAVSISDLHLLPTTPKTEINNGSGLVKISQLANTNGSYKGSGRLATVTFKPLFSGSANLNILYTPGLLTDSNVISKSSGKDILDKPTSLTITANSASTLSINYSSPKPTLGTITDTTSSWSSNWNNTPVDTTQFTGQTKTFVFKASGYLAKKFTISFVSGENFVDLGQLLAGDLNNDEIINNIDLSLMYDQWFGPGTADINGDNVVNSADYWYLTNNFLKTND